MPTQRLDQAHLTVITHTFVASSPVNSGAAQEMRSAKVPIVIQIYARKPAVQHKPAVPCPPKVAKGFAWALALEGIAALAIFAVGHFWHLLRLPF